MKNPAFTALLEQRMRAATPQERAEADRKIRERYERNAAVLIIDMSGFSRITQEEGIVHFLALIHQMHQLVLPIVDASDEGRVVKTEADNVYAMFDSAQAAVDTAVALQDACHGTFVDTAPNDTVALSIGIAWGRILDLDGQEYFGDPVNLASKLGEDLATGGEVFVTRTAAEHVVVPPGWTSVERRDRISDVDLDFVALVRT